jgi:Zn-dependent alcohol dehydrogenase
MTGVGAVLNTAQVPAGSTVAVWGAGGIGLNVVQGAALVAAGEIIVVDMLENKLEFARRFGATHTINAALSDPVEAIRARTRRGVDYAFVATGHINAIEQAWQSLANAGTCVVIGMPGTGEMVQIAGRGIASSERVLRGSFYGSARTRVDFPRMVELYRSGKLDIDGLINRKFTLDEADEAYRALAAGELARGVIVN